MPISDVPRCKTCCDEGVSDFTAVMLLPCPDCNPSPPPAPKKKEEEE